MLQKCLLTLWALAVMQSFVYAEPFGPFVFKMGMTFDEAVAIEGIEITEIDSVGYDRSIKFKIPPDDDFDFFGLFEKEPEDFVRFQLFFTPAHGLYMFYAWSEPTDVGTGGENILKKYYAIRDKITESYPSAGFRKSKYFSGHAAEPPEDWRQRLRSFGGEGFVSEWRDLSAIAGEPIKDNIAEMKLSIFPGAKGKGVICAVVNFRNTYVADKLIWENSDNR